MAQLGGRRPYLGGTRWIDYVVFYTASDDGQRVLYESVLRDEIGICPEAPSGTVEFVPGATAEETARAAICAFIDTHHIGPGRPPPDPQWALKHVLRGGRL